MALSIKDINKEYFGHDKRKNYLKNDFSVVLHDIIQRDILLQAFSECSEARHYEKRRKNRNGSETVSVGDFDPDNAGFLLSIFDTYEKGFMVDVRQLLVSNETGAGGKFIKDLATLTVADFIDYYKNSQTNGVAIPHLLISELIKNDKAENKLTPTNFIDHNISKIENGVDTLTTKVAQFHSQNHFDQIIKDYQALKLHKDRQPEKYNVKEEIEEFGLLTVNKSTRHDKAKVEIGKIADYLNGFAEIIELYQSLVSSNTSLFGSNWSLEMYVQRTFALFAKEVSEDIQKKVMEDIVKYLDKSLHIVGWRHTSVK